MQYSADEINFIEQNKNLPRRVLHAKFVEVFNRPDVTYDNIKKYCWIKGWKANRNVHRIYSDAELLFVSENRRLPRKELHELFLKEFGRSDITQKGLGRLCRARRWLTGRARVKIEWSAAELEFVEQRRQLTRSHLHRLFVEHFDRKEITKTQIGSLCTERRWHSGRPVKNTPCPSGTERMLKGYIMIRIDQHNPRHKSHRSRWILKHYWLWEKQNGAVPDGFSLKCRDGNTLNSDPSNWVCVPRGVISRLNKRDYGNAPTELKPTIMAVARLEHAATQARK